MDATPLEELRQARQALFEAVVTLPFDLAEPRPSITNDPRTDAAVDVFVGKCRAWHDHGVSAFNHARIACQNPIIPDVEPRNMVPLTAFIGEPQFGDPAFAEGAHDLHFAQGFMASFDNRCKRENERFAEMFKKMVPSAKPGNEPCPARDHQALMFCLGLRRRALDYIDWIDRALERLDTAFLPRLTLGAEIGDYGRQPLRVEIMGRTDKREVSGAVALALRELKGGKTSFNDRKALTRFTSDDNGVPEYRKRLVKVPAGKGQNIYKLPDVLRQRLTIEGDS
jgi:hypothetical protein